MRRRRAGLRPGQAIVPALERDRPIARPERPHDRDRLLERVHRLLRRPAGAAHRLDRIPERSSPDAELDSPVAQHVERSRRLGDDRRQAQREVEHVRHQADLLGPSGEIGEQRPGVEEAALVGMVLDRDVIEPGLVGGDRLSDRRRGVLGTGHEKDADLGHYREANAPSSAA
jgi:hypothetical protein